MINRQQRAAYLQRINYDGPLQPTLAVLQSLQLAHLYRVPFENLSIHNDEPIVLEPALLYDKIVLRERGGFCYEMNSNFGQLLRSIGFDVAYLAAGVARDKGGFGPTFDHLTLRVMLDEPWLVDVGFGDSFRQPLRLSSRAEQAEIGRTYRLDADGDARILMERKLDGAWRPQYRFGPETYQLADYAAQCVYHQTSAESTFTQKRVCTLATPNGRITLSGSALITSTLAGERSKTPVSEAEREAILRDKFNVRLELSAS